VDKDNPPQMPQEVLAFLRQKLQGTEKINSSKLRPVAVQVVICEGRHSVQVIIEPLMQAPVCTRGSTNMDHPFRGITNDVYAETVRGAELRALRWKLMKRPTTKLPEKLNDFALFHNYDPSAEQLFDRIYSVYSALRFRLFLDLAQPRFSEQTESSTRRNTPAASRTS
jgi:hypothetical protein